MDPNIFVLHLVKVQVLQPGHSILNRYFFVQAILVQVGLNPIVCPRIGFSRGKDFNLAIQKNLWLKITDFFLVIALGYQLGLAIIETVWKSAPLSLPRSAVRRPAWGGRLTTPCLGVDGRPCLAHGADSPRLPSERQRHGSWRLAYKWGWPLKLSPYSDFNLFLGNYRNYNKITVSWSNELWPVK